MAVTVRGSVFSFMVAALVWATNVTILAQPDSDPPEIRALWVDAFHAGIRSRAEIQELIAAAQRAHLNTLFVQVRRRGDALYTKGIEPPLDDPAYDPSFDALAEAVDAGHRAGFQVHAWINAMPVWRDEAPPRDARHVFNRHGPAATGEENWLTTSPQGNMKFPVGYFVDPGHPAAAAYTAELYLNVVRNYNVDGIHFDYIRYPETDDRLPRGAGVGYNPVAVARFQRATGRTDVPAPADERWMDWRRQQVTNLVRRVAIEAKAINPKIRISASVIPWGQPPTDEEDFSDVAPMQRVFQNWHQWLKDGLLDLAVPMNYATETDARVRQWFDGWIKWEKRHKHGRQLAVGLGAYRNTPPNTLAQLARVRAPEGTHAVDGVSFFSYGSSQPAAQQNGQPPVDVAAESVVARLAYLADGAGASAAAFKRAAPVPAMAWIDRPTHGWIAGVVPGRDAVLVKVKRTGVFSFLRRARRIETDGNGYFGLTNIKPGRYRVWLDDDSKPAIRLTVEAGKVARAKF